MAFVVGMRGTRCHRAADRPVAAIERFGVGGYGATVRVAGHPGANAGIPSTSRSPSIPIANAR
jgi:hypothetical protein